MQKPMSLKSAERKVFQTTFADGLWDVLIGCFVLEFAIAPFFSRSLGDFWSSAVFLPFWGLVYLGIWLTRKYVVTPRIGTVSFGKSRKHKLRKFSVVMVVVNVLFFILGIVAFLIFSKNPSARFSGFWSSTPILMGVFMLVFFSAAAFILDIPRLYLYGLMLFIAPPIGEWLYQNQGASHHGFPIVFGFSAGVMILTGLVLFIRLLIIMPPVQSQEA